MGSSEDERRGIRNPSFVLCVAVDAEALLNGSLQLRDHLQVALGDGHRENGFENLVIGILDCCFLRSSGEPTARSSADTCIPCGLLDYMELTFDGGVLPLKRYDFIFEGDNFLLMLLTDGFGLRTSRM